MNAKSSIVVLSLVAVLGAAASLPLWAQQPFPTSPSRKGGQKDVSIPVGNYTALVFACEGTRDTGAKVLIKSPSGDLIVVVSGGDSLVIPTEWKLGQEAQMLIVEQAGATLHVTAMSVNGPVNLLSDKSPRK